MRDRGRLCVFKALTKKALATKIYDIQQANLAAIENTLARTDAALSMMEYVAAITDTVSVRLEKRQSAIQEGRIDLDHCSLPFFLRRGEMYSNERLEEEGRSPRGVRRGSGVVGGGLWAERN